MKKIILLGALLLASCSSGNIETIKRFYENDSRIIEVKVTESVRNCSITNWKETLVIGSTRVERTVKTECLNVYSVEYLNDNNQFVDTTVAEYRLTDHKVNILVTSGRVIVSKTQSIPIADYLKELNNK